MPSSVAAPAPATSYWCHRCNRFVRVWAHDAVVCPTCDGGFLEAVETPPRLLHPPADPRRRRFPTTAVNTTFTAAAGGRPNHEADMRFRRNRRASAGDRSPFNPVIVLRSPSDSGGRGRVDADRSNPSSFDLYYDDGAGSGLRPLPSSMSEFLMGSGFDRLLDQLSQIGTNGAGGGRGCEHPPASKSAIESMPTVKISAGHIKMESHCAVCKESFELETEAREMPCKHIYHQDCILPWLLLRNSCPVCRHEMPADLRGRSGSGPELDGGEGPNPPGASEEDGVGLTIWRLPGGGFAVGRFSVGSRAGERELPVVYTEMDGGFNTGGAPRRISWPHRGNRARQSRGIGRAVHNFFSFFGCFGGSATALSSGSRPEPGSSSSRRTWRAPTLDNPRRRRRNWALEDENGNEIARW